MASKKVASEATLSFSGTVGYYGETVVGHVGGIQNLHSTYS